MCKITLAKITVVAIGKNLRSRGYMSELYNLDTFNKKTLEKSRVFCTIVILFIVC
jgi:hypothetical protein